MYPGTFLYTLQGKQWSRSILKANTVYYSVSSAITCTVYATTELNLVYQNKLQCTIIIYK